MNNVAALQKTLDLIAKLATVLDAETVATFEAMAGKLSDDLASVELPQKLDGTPWTLADLAAIPAEEGYAAVLNRQ